MKYSLKKTTVEWDDNTKTETVTVNCEQCDWTIGVTKLTKQQAFQEAQDHEDIEHEGRQIEWGGVH